MFDPSLGNPSLRFDIEIAEKISRHWVYQID